MSLRDNIKVPRSHRGQGLLRVLRALAMTVLTGFPFLLFYSEVSAQQSQEIEMTFHVHSSTSSGGWAISKIAEFAQDQNMDVVIMTDLLRERYEYGLWPFRDWLKFTVQRGSILKDGIRNYLDKVRDANQTVPEVLTLTGLVATPYYYWTGKAWPPGPLVMNGRGKDLIVVGLEEVSEIDSLPLVGGKFSKYTPYDGPQYERPYQDFIDDVTGKGGLVFWSHPSAQEHFAWRVPVLNTEIQLHTSDYSKEVLQTHGYTGIGIYPWEVSQVLNHPSSIAYPGGLWDQVLKQYCNGRRDDPVWLIGEVDYTGLPDSNTDLSAVKNVIPHAKKSRESILEHLKQGRFYVVSSGEKAGGRLRLAKFEIGESGLEPNPEVRLLIEHTAAASLEVHVTLIRDGKMYDQRTGTLPFEYTWIDSTPPPDGKSYYRILVTTESGDRLISNPLFVSSRR